MQCILPREIAHMQFKKRKKEPYNNSNDDCTKYNWECPSTRINLLCLNARAHIHKNYRIVADRRRQRGRSTQREDKRKAKKAGNSQLTRLADTFFVKAIIGTVDAFSCRLGFLLLFIVPFHCGSVHLFIFVALMIMNDLNLLYLMIYSWLSLWFIYDAFANERDSSIKQSNW